MENRPSLQNTLARISRIIPAFGAQHLRCGLTLARYLVDGVDTDKGDSIPGLGIPYPGVLQDLALDVTWIFWLDDTFDTEPDQSSDQMLCVADLEDLHDDSTLEAWSAVKVRDSFLVGDRSPAEWGLWTQSVVDMTCAFQRNKHTSRGSRGWTYAEYVANGELSSGIPHFMATVSLLFGLDLAHKLANPVYSRLIRNLSLEMRFENDLVSFDKELDEGDCSNVFIVIGDVMQPRAAIAFIEEQRSAYERMVLDDVERLGMNDPIAHAARLILEAAHEFHSRERVRYSNTYDLATTTESVASSEAVF